MNGLPDTTPTNRARPRWFVRGVAVLVGLANLFVLVHLFGGYSPDPSRTVWEDITRMSMWEDVTLNQALAPVLVTVLSGLAISEVVLWGFRRDLFSERFDQRYVATATAVCLGGALMGALLAGVFVLQGALGSTYMLTPAQRVPAALYTSILGVMYGGGLGLVEGLILAYPLAHTLGRSRNGG
jgi:hypothetical protein